MAVLLLDLQVCCTLVRSRKGCYNSDLWDKSSQHFFCNLSTFQLLTLLYSKTKLHSFEQISEKFLSHIQLNTLLLIHESTQLGTREMIKCVTEFTDLTGKQALHNHLTLDLGHLTNSSQHYRCWTPRYRLKLKMVSAFTSLHNDGTERKIRIIYIFYKRNLKFY